ncbi:hypothetical protein CC85DRAFT_287903 [Cutaneotrichosporon oleaginosum]|uniref:Amino acid transporter transmembrane domain-containing protein n=2 Tax=Cutaneotrichosporon oleaginosum TaxID=879819 RepID=A0A0J0XG47_9TREE|nr:uncharacterized protein CC85DRAFT_287903 [Cutaneotrichosporon oleaginosum]KLT40021.1 hypothetical protein CC85DRAFT_287903 [Cutaneotrichosporon oleaginosum]
MGYPEKRTGSPGSGSAEEGYAVHSAVDDTRHDAVFGDMEEGGPNFRNVGWIGATVLMIKSAFGLGVLSIPFVFQAVGIVPGVILIVVVELIVTWSAFVLGSFKLNHRECYSMADVGRILAGRWGEEFFTLAVCICMLFFSASGMVGVTTAFNAVTTHATCTAVWMVVVFVVSFGFASIRTLGNITWLAWPAFFSILSAVLVMTIAVGVQDRPNDAPATPAPWDKDFKIFNKTDFVGGISAVATILFAAAGTPTYFGIISEMREPRLYHRAMLINQTFVTLVYIVIGSVVYWYCGQYVSQPSLGSAGRVMKKICYGLSIPGLFFSVILWVHIPAKFIFVRLLRGSEHLTRNSVTHWATWLIASFACTTVAYIIGSAIPILNSIISLVGALIAPTLCITPFGAMWLHDNVRGRSWRSLSTWKQAQTAWAILVILIGVFITVAGTYGAVVTIVKQPGEGSPWSCADNSNSV